MNFRQVPHIGFNSSGRIVNISTPADGWHDSLTPRSKYGPDPTALLHAMQIGVPAKRLNLRRASIKSNGQGRAVLQGMRTESNLSQFAEYHRNAGKVLTIILNVDQSLAVNRNRNFEIPLNEKLREIETGIKEKDEADQFARCAQVGRKLIQSYQPRSKSLLLFLRANGNVTTRELNVPLSTEVYWADTPHIQPLIEAGDEYEELLIVLLDGRQSRFLTSILGHITEYPEVLNPSPTSHTQAPGNDRQKSQPTFHRKADQREHSYLKAASQMTEDIAANRSINRIVLAGSDGVTRELYSLLSKETRKHVISFAVLPVQATLEQVADTVRKAQYRAERENELTKVASLLDRAGGGNKAVTGLIETMAALAEGRVHELIYAQGISPTGALCEACGSIVLNQTACTKCNSPAGTAGEAAGEAMDLIIGAVLDTGSTIEQVRGAAAEKLLAAGGIGAFLRY